MILKSETVNMQKKNSDLFETRSPSHCSLAPSACQCSVQMCLHFENDFQGPTKFTYEAKWKFKLQFNQSKLFEILICCTRSMWTVSGKFAFAMLKRPESRNYWSFESGLAEIKVLIFKRRITARAITDDKSSCGVVPASKWKGVLYVVENKHCARSLSNIVYMKYQCLRKTIKRQKKIKISHFDSSDHHQGMVAVVKITTLWCGCGCQVNSSAVWLNLLGNCGWIVC